MNRSQDRVKLIEEWLSDGPEVAPDRVLAAIAGRLSDIRQERRLAIFQFGWAAAFAAAAVTFAAALGIAYLVTRDHNIGPEPSASPTPAFGATDVLAFVRAGDLWVAAEDGSNAHALTTGGGVGAPAWSPDGDLLSYDQSGNLYTISADHTVRQVTTAAGPLYGPSWSPNGQQLVVTGPDGFVIVSFDGTVRELSQRDLGLCVTSPDWGPADLIAFTGNPACPTGAEPTSIYTVNPDGSAARELYGHGSQVDEAAWSPDGTAIAFVDLAGGGCIYVMDANGTNVRRVKPGCTKAFGIAWSPDGTRLAWAGGPHGEAPAFVIDIDGSSLDGIPGLTSVANLAWRPTR